MVRKGWSQLEVPNGWIQLIRGPRPKSVQWPRVSQPAEVRVPRQPKPNAPVAKPNAPVAKTSGMRPFGDPSVKVTAAQEGVAKLESALAALQGVEGPEVDSLRAALKRAKDVKLTPLDVQAKECEAFLARARAHLTELDAKRAVAGTNIKEAEQIQLQHSAPPPPPVPDAETELRQLRETVAQLKGQLHHTKPAATVEVPISKRQCRRDEDFVPMCVEELQEWIAGRQADLHEAMVAGRPDEAARVSDIMGQAVQQWQREVSVSCMPSVVTNRAS